MVRVTTTLLVMLSMGASTLVLPAQAQDASRLGDLVKEAEAEKVGAVTSGDAVTSEDEELPEEIELLTDSELDDLVAPVALYPDALLAQVLVAATFPLQIVKADRVIADSEGLSDEELKAAIADQEWDPSVLVLLSGFPTVVQRMSDDLEWTEKLGNAMVQQDDDVLDAVQRMRAEAQDTGYLATNEAQTVNEEDGHIYITPTDPKVVYVPTYDTNTVYTQAPTAQPYIQPYNQPYVVQQQQSANPLTNPWVAGALGFGGGLLVQELWGDNDDDDNDDGWDDYWGRGRPIDYDNREFYPRPRPHVPAYAWANERDSYWNRRDWAWRRDAAAQRRWEEDRRDAARWTIVENPITGEPQISHMRDRIRLTPAKERNHIAIDRNEERLKQEQQRRQQQARQEQRLEADKQDARRAVRERAEKQEAREKAEKQDAREKAARQEAREKAAKQEARAKAEKQEARQKADAQAESERKAKAAARAKQEERSKQAAQDKARQQKAADQKAQQQKAAQQKAQQQAEQQKAAQRKAQADREAQKQRAAQQQKQPQKAQPQKQQKQQEKRKKICAEDDKNCKQQNN